MHPKLSEKKVKSTKSNIYTLQYTIQGISKESIQFFLLFLVPCEWKLAFLQNHLVNHLKKTKLKADNQNQALHNHIFRVFRRIKVSYFAVNTTVSTLIL